MAQDISKNISNCKEIESAQTESNGSVDSWLIEVKRTFNPERKIWHVSTKVCIYRVPKAIMDWNPEAYCPLLISFGPYHQRETPQLIKMDQYKIEAIHRMLARLKKDVTNLIAEVQKLESEIRECYAEPIELDAETLSWMLLMDACFILEFFYSSAKLRCDSSINYFNLIFQNINMYNSMYHSILGDILKLENQIPLCILITVLQLECETREKATTELAVRLSRSKLFAGSPFSPSLSRHECILKLKEHIQKDPPPCHLLDLSRMMIKDVLAHSTSELASNDEYYDGNGHDNITSNRGPCGWWRNVRLLGWMQRLSWISISKSSRYASSSTSNPPLAFGNMTFPCSLLQGAGIKFQPGKIGFEKRRFRSSTLFLPRIELDGGAERMLRNLLAYEECQRCSWSPEETVISHNVRVVKNLIDSGKDVSILKNSDVLWNVTASDEDTARMFQCIMKGTTMGQSKEVKEVLRRVRDHYKSQWMVWVSQFRAEYCSKPWYLISLLVAILILGMTAVQTVYSVKK